MFFYDLVLYKNIISFTNSFLLIFGFILIGRIISYSFIKFELPYIQQISISFSIGIASFLLILFPIFLFYTININLIKAVSYLILGSGLFFLFSDFNKLKKYNINFFFLIILIIIVSVKPPIDSDSLDYHLISGWNILNENKIIFDKFFFESYLISNFSIINALAFSIGAVEFNSLVQGFSLIGIIFLLYNENNKNWLYLVLLAISPIVVITLLLTSKPILIYVNFLCISLFLFLKAFSTCQKSSNLNFLKKILIPICFLPLLCFLGKFSFFFIIIILNLFFFHFILKNNLKLINLFIIINTIGFIIIIFPYFAWKYSIDGILFSKYIIPYFHGTENFINYLKNYKEHEDFILFIIPKNLSALTRYFGPVLFILLLIKYNKSHFLFCTYVIISVLLKLTFIQRASRFYLEEFYLLLIFFSNSNINFYYENFCKFFIKFLAIINYLVLFSLAILIFPTFFSTKIKVNFMNQYSSNFSLWRQINSSNLIDKGDLLLTEISSNIFYKGKSLRFTFHDYTEYENYYFELKEKDPKFVLIKTKSNNIKNNKTILKLSKVFNLEKVQVFNYNKATKNPFKNNKGTYEATLYKIKN